MQQRTIGRLWEAANGRPAGFDYLRISLAAMVILMHAPLVSYGRESAASMARGLPFLHPIYYFVLPSFFALSGFLVAGSLLRNDLVSFAALRVIRIFPALMAEVIICALTIGPIFTIFALRQYFTDSRFFAYFFNMLGYIHFRLPGVFTTLPYPDIVNEQLWTVPIELECYISLIFLALVGLHRRIGFFLLFTILLTLGLLIYNTVNNSWPAPDQPATARILVLNFLFGVFFFILKDRFVMNKWLALASLACFIALCTSTIGVYLTPFFSAYTTIGLGLTNRRFAPLIGLSNYSYGVYLYGFPVQQVVASIFPQYRIWWFNFAVSVVAAAVLGAISWHSLEVKFGDRKKFLLASLHRLLSAGGAASGPVVSKLGALVSRRA